MQLKSMSFDRLVSLREKVETALRARIADTRSDLEARLKKLSAASGSQKTGRRGLRGRVPPKYCNPDNPARGAVYSRAGSQPRSNADLARKTFSLTEHQGSLAKRPRLKRQRLCGSAHHRARRRQRHGARRSHARHRSVARQRSHQVHGRNPRSRPRHLPIRAPR
jgi:hypothetical protein